MKQEFYWYHPESDCLFITETNEHPGDLCESITKEEYEKLKAEIEEAKRKVEDG